MSIVEYICCNMCGKEISRNERKELEKWRTLYISSVTKCQALSTKQWDMCPKCYQNLQDQIQLLQRKNNAETTPDVSEENTPDASEESPPVPKPRESYANGEKF